MRSSIAKKIIISLALAFLAIGVSNVAFGNSSNVSVTTISTEIETQVTYNMTLVGHRPGFNVTVIYILPPRNCSIYFVSENKTYQKFVLSRPDVFLFRIPPVNTTMSIEGCETTLRQEITEYGFTVTYNGVQNVKLVINGNETEISLLGKIIESCPDVLTELLYIFSVEEPNATIVVNLEGVNATLKGYTTTITFKKPVHVPEATLTTYKIWPGTTFKKLYIFEGTTSTNIEEVVIPTTVTIVTTITYGGVMNQTSGMPYTGQSTMIITRPGGGVFIPPAASLAVIGLAAISILVAYAIHRWRRP